MYIAQNPATLEVVGQGKNRAALAVQHPTANVYKLSSNAQQHLAAGGTVEDMRLTLEEIYAAPLDRVEDALKTVPSDLRTVLAYALHSLVRDAEDYDVPQHHLNALTPDDSPDRAMTLDALRRVLNLPRKFGPIEALKTALSQ